LKEMRIGLDVFGRKADSTTRHSIPSSGCRWAVCARSFVPTTVALAQWIVFG
jgi:hypothetical protein